ncbi:MAG: processing protein [Patescibacteria group bacterium]|nr:processing protein [Patescibacteria group bacterium]
MANIHKIHYLSRYNPDFPQSLRNLDQKCLEIFVKGDPEILKQGGLAVVGSRNISNYGKQVTYQLVTEIAWANIPIISGLALGVDSHAHHACVQAKGVTIAVIPSGIERIYPASHQQLAEKIIKEGGAIVSEHPGTMRPHKYHFIQRNRIIAALAQAVLIPEATQKSGSLHTAQFALDDGKEIMAVPGSIFSPTSSGTNQLIASGAQLVSDAQQVIKHFHKQASLPLTPPKGETLQEQIIIDIIQTGTSRNQQIYDAAKLKTQFNIVEFNQIIGKLEGDGKIQLIGSQRWGISQSFSPP